jgi:hypothetical protein
MADGRAKQLISTGDFRGALDWLSARKQLSHTERAVRAHIELEIGDTAEAHAQATSLLNERIDARTRA